MVATIPVAKVSDLLKYLFGLGFTERNAVNLLTRSVWSLRQPAFIMSIFDILKSYNLTPDCMMAILENLPSDFKEEKRPLDELPDLLASSLKGLTNLGFFNDDLNSVLTRNPQIIFLSFQECVSILSKLNGLTAASVKALDLILKYPNILTDDWDETLKKFEYAYYNMGYEVEDISKSSIFMHDYNHIRNRHVYLIRTGFFVKIKRKDDEKFPNVNPSLKTVLDSTDVQFAKMFGNLSKEEYLVYLRMRQLEAKAEENESQDSDESDNERS
ncbi:hypothetical protein Btru_031275 [Bulinus truncatus]|nr:hypothetical protein Btru_031275 [Bulinus truncatus]